jgi:hypothetical protein
VRPCVKEPLELGRRAGYVVGGPVVHLILVRQLDLHIAAVDLGLLWIRRRLRREFVGVGRVIECDERVWRFRRGLGHLADSPSHHHVAGMLQTDQRAGTHFRTHIVSSGAS